jgi:hypothetical protein
MADGFSATFADSLLNVLEGTAPATFTSVFFELHTGDPGSAGTTDLSIGDTGRVAGTFAAASAGSIALTGTPPSFTNTSSAGSPAGEETITDVAAWSAATGGTFLFSGQAATSKTWTEGDTIQITSLTVALTPIAS